MSASTEKPEWRRGCASGTCIEVARIADRYLIRDSKSPDTVLSFTEEEWNQFVGGVRDGVFRF